MLFGSLAMDLGAKIARLVEERGWNQEDFARIARLNRHTVRQILKSDDKRRLRNDTVQKCAEALGLSVNDLRNVTLERLLPRMYGKRATENEGVLKTLQEQATMPELIAWLQRNQERANRISAEEIPELLAMQGPDGPLARFGVDQCLEMLERRRKLLVQVRAIASTEYLCLLEKMVELIYEKVQPS